jgi:D-alanyl-lipoteichoic acid acyltransferase DltB (MBOAT superfamily)
MLFSSFEFIFLFFPIVVGGYYLLQAKGLDQYKSYWLLASSIGFYLFWQWEDLIPLLISTTVNYGFYSAMTNSPSRKPYLILGIAFNILFLAWYKYPLVFLQTDYKAIPLGISFYTFTQIAFLVDGYSQRFNKLTFPNYALFVGYFPHLVCGPILIFKDFYPQLLQKARLKINVENVTYFLFFFSMGLFKKTFIADPLGLYVSAVYDGNSTILMHYQTNLLASLCYAFQLYADFSGYTDMAIGLSRLFGIVIPFNFNSPYKASSIIEFWRRWHMSLANFLKNYIYIPLGGNRTSPFRNSLNLIIVFTLGGIWHGSALTFLVWGIYHGLLLAINHQYRRLASFSRAYVNFPKGLNTLVKVLLTFGFVCVGWILFGSQNLEQSYAILKSIWSLDDQGTMIYFTTKWQYIALLFGIGYAFWLPETQHLYEHLQSAEKLKYKFASQLWACAGLVSGVLLAIGILLINKPQQFLYSGF